MTKTALASTTSLTPPPRPCKRIVVGDKGGVGKSTTVVNLFTAMKAAGQRPYVVEYEGVIRKTSNSLASVNEAPDLALMIPTAEQVKEDGDIRDRVHGAILQAIDNHDTVLVDMPANGAKDLLAFAYANRHAERTNGGADLTFVVCGMAYDGESDDSILEAVSDIDAAYPRARKLIVMSRCRPGEIIAPIPGCEDIPIVQIDSETGPVMRELVFKGRLAPAAIASAPPFEIHELVMSEVKGINPHVAYKSIADVCAWYGRTANRLLAAIGMGAAREVRADRPFGTTPRRPAIMRLKSPAR
jgi:GTPase SAR1 family protein